MKEKVNLSSSTSNNEAAYDILLHGLKMCVGQKIQHLMVKGDALLIVKQILGIWTCKNEKFKKMGRGGGCSAGSCNSQNTPHRQHT